MFHGKQIDLADGSHPLRAALRDGTRSLHDRIEALWAPDEHFASPQRYHAFLRTALDVHVRIGLAAARARQDPGGSAEEEARISALSADLAVQSRPSAPPCAMDPAYAWGVGYVLNGSSLGATTILRYGALGDGWPRAYFEQLRDFAASGRLRAFFDRLNGCGLPPREVRRGALDTFARFDRMEDAWPAQ